MKERPPTMPPTRWPTATWPVWLELSRVADSAAEPGPVGMGVFVGTVGMTAISCSLLVEDGTTGSVGKAMSLSAESAAGGVVAIGTTAISDVVVVSDAIIGAFVTDSGLGCTACC
jgi:hypothetical protein